MVAEAIHPLLPQFGAPDLKEAIWRVPPDSSGLTAGGALTLLCSTEGVLWGIRSPVAICKYFQLFLPGQLLIVFRQRVCSVYFFCWTP